MQNDSPAANSPSGQPMPRVLAVDDNPELLKSLVRTIGRTCDLTTAVDGKDALEKFKELGPFPVVLTDQRMPKMAGDALIDELKKIAPETVCLLITGNVHDAEVKRVMKQPDAVHQLMAKPCSTAQIFAAITDATRAYKMAERLRETAERQ